MAMPPREALRRLCLEFGWSYAVLWRAIAAAGNAPTHLTWEDGYYAQKSYLSGSCDEIQASQIGGLTDLSSQANEDVRMLFNKMRASQVHAIGDGLIGEVASSGNHQWVVRDNLHKCGPFASKGIAEINSQIQAGIQTIAVVPVLPYGIIQFGSMQKLLEDTAFVNLVKGLFSHIIGGLVNLRSDSTGRALVQEGHMYSLPSTLISACQSISSSTPLDVLPRHSIELVKFFPNYFPESYYSVLSPSDKVPPAALGVMSNVRMSETAHPSHKPIPHIINQTRSRVLDELPLKQGIGPKRRILPSYSGPACQNHLSAASSDLSPKVLMQQAEKLLLTSGSGTIETKRDLDGPLDDSKCVGHDAKIEPFDVSSYIHTIGPLPCGTIASITSRGNLPVTGAPPSLYQQCDLNSSLSISQASKFNIDINGVSLAESGKKILKKEDDIIQASCGEISESDVLGSCSVLLSGTSRKNGPSRSNSILADHSLQISPYDTYGACPPIANGQDVLKMKERKLLQRSKSGASVLPFESSTSDLFDLLGFDCKESPSSGGLDDVLASTSAANSCKSSATKSLAIFNIHSFDVTSDEISCSKVFSMTNSDQLLDAMISKISSGANQGSDYSASCKTSMPNVGGSHCSDSANKAKHDPLSLRQEQGLPSVFVKTDETSSSYDKTSRSFIEVEDQRQGTAIHKSNIRLWVESGPNIYNDNMSAVNSKNVVEGGKLNRKRPRPGENPRPRPKDRQMIQDRVKELREIVPNGAKCSIDALLEKTIKHMLFLQSVTKHADKLKDTGEPKISNEEGGFLLKDNFEGGATWAFEVGTQTITCPIIVEDLNPPWQLLVEMLCEERGFFLEIADFIRGLGLTILKGVMIARKNNVWARFAVEANRDVTRMEIFLSLVRLLETHGGSNVPPPNVGNINLPRTMFHQNTIPATGLSSNHD